MELGTEVPSVRQHLGAIGVWVSSSGNAIASIYKYTSFSGFITDVDPEEIWDAGTFNSVECLGDPGVQNPPPPPDAPPPTGDSCVISDGTNEVDLQPGTEVSSVRQHLGAIGVWVSSSGNAIASIYKYTSFSGFITDVDPGEIWDAGTFNSIKCM